MSPLSHPMRWSARIGSTIALALTVAACNPNATTPAVDNGAFVDTGKGTGYTFHIAYPPLPANWSALDKAMREFGAANKREVIASNPDWKAGEAEASLDLSFDIARRTANFISVLSNGGIFTGGAHGMPLTASFNLNLTSGKLIVLNDLFTDPALALEALSNECRRQLDARFEARLREVDAGAAPEQLAADLDAARQWIEKGTAPNPENYRVFLVDGLDAPAIGLTLIFTPYQVASYADGVQQVEVPAAVFYKLLKPYYRDAFAIDTQAAQRDVR